MTELLSSEMTTVEISSLSSIFFFRASHTVIDPLPSIRNLTLSVELNGIGWGQTLEKGIQFDFPSLEKSRLFHFQAILWSTVAGTR